MSPEAARPSLARATVDETKFNSAAELPYDLRLKDFELGMQDVYDFFYDVNNLLLSRGLGRLEDILRKQAMSGVLSDMLTASMAKHSRVLTQNAYHNGHPDLIVRGRYPHDMVQAGEDGVEVKATLKHGGAVDMHGARNQWLCVFVYEVDNITEPASNRNPLIFTEIYLNYVSVDDFRHNARGELGTRTVSLHRGGIEKLRRNWVYLVRPRPPRARTAGGSV